MSNTMWNKTSKQLDWMDGWTTIKSKGKSCDQMNQKKNDGQLLVKKLGVKAAANQGANKKNRSNCCCAKIIIFLEVSFEATVFCFVNEAKIKITNSFINFMFKSFESDLY